MRRLVLLGFVLAIVAAGGIAVVGAAQDHPPPDADNVTTGVTISVDSGQHDDGIGMMIEWKTVYPARSEAEAERARNETLDAEWHQGSDYVRAVRERHPGGRIDVNLTVIKHRQSETYEHGEISVRTKVRWIGPFNENERIVFGPELTGRLSNGDGVRISVPDDWPVANASVGPTRGNTRNSYEWTIGEGPEPHFVVTEDAVPEESEITWMDWAYWGIMFGATAIVLLLAKRVWDRKRVG